MDDRTLAEEIYYKLQMKLSKRNDISYWLIDLTDNNKTPIVIIEKHGELLNRWKAYIHMQSTIDRNITDSFKYDNTDIDLCQYYRTRKHCVAMARYHLANWLADDIAPNGPKYRIS